MKIQRLLFLIFVITTFYFCTTRQTKEKIKQEQDTTNFPGDTIYVQGDTVVLKNDTLVRNLLLKVNLNQYIGKTVGELLVNDTIKRYKKYFFIDEPPCVLSSLNLIFARGLHLQIRAYPLKYTPRFSKTEDFDFNLFKKEKIRTLRIDREYFEQNVVKKYKSKNKPRPPNTRLCSLAG